ncbi:hypothetical protein ATCV1_z093R [Acanthocystis turfacea chlorella virus 1]|uniref:Uncharacterized protein z093R n=1 Tax=Chlorovirus heliozoae TaxID=322019 RepID=A7K853_9PHYC|nr:hypothetical protein ATCV1_z093R [Acanthocystis turfacea chlorella virus 1]ABT16227.1 hypothetical protein ATCV1_z093R [Acanthocystis turfacea chlorella virus 1]
MFSRCFWSFCFSSGGALAIFLLRAAIFLACVVWAILRFCFLDLALICAARFRMLLTFLETKVVIPCLHMLGSTLHGMTRPTLPSFIVCRGYCVTSYFFFAANLPFLSICATSYL